MNKARNEKDLVLGYSIANVIQKYLMIDINFLGVVPFDERVHSCLKDQTPFLTRYPDSKIGTSIKNIVGKLEDINQ